MELVLGRIMLLVACSLLSLQRVLPRALPSTCGGKFTSSDRAYLRLAYPVSRVSKTSPAIPPSSNLPSLPSYLLSLWDKSSFSRLAPSAAVLPRSNNDKVHVCCSAQLQHHWRAVILTILLGNPVPAGGGPWSPALSACARLQRQHHGKAKSASSRNHSDRWSTQASCRGMLILSPAQNQMQQRTPSMFKLPSVWQVLRF